MNKKYLLFDLDGTLVNTDNIYIDIWNELLKPYKKSKKNIRFWDVKSVSIMGKAGILEGGKGDIMLPSAHVFEGTADNYPFKNMLKKSHFVNNLTKRRGLKRPFQISLIMEFFIPP